jgi:hypothetical protein
VSFHRSLGFNKFEDVMLALISFGLSLDHQTPTDHVKSRHVLLCVDSLFEKSPVKRGDLLLLGSDSLHGVLSLANHRDFLIYVGLSDLSGLQLSVCGWLKGEERENVGI